MTTKLIKWTDTGPVKENIVEVDQEGGLYVLQGPCGSGKSHMLQALDDALNPSNKSRIPVRDGAPRAEIDIFGEVILRRSQKSSRLGVLEAVTLEGKFSIADLVDPGIDKPEAADAKRIKALIQLQGNSEADPALFYAIASGKEKFDEIVSVDAVATEDLVILAANVKRAFEKAARDAEAVAVKKATEAEAIQLSGNLTPDQLNAAADADNLAAEYEAATREESRLREASKAYEQALENRAKAKAALKKAQDEYKGVDLATAQKAADSANVTFEADTKTVADLEAQLENAKRALLESKFHKNTANLNLKAAQQHDTNITSLTALAEIKLPELVLEIDLTTAKDDVKKAREAQEFGVLVRKAKDDVKKAAELRIEARNAHLTANQYTQTAKATESVLADAVASLGLPLSVRNGRLIITNSTRNSSGEELFADLSKGQRCALVVDIAIKAVKKPGKRGMFVIPQEFFEGLDETHILAIARQLDESGVVAVSAKAVDGDGITVKKIEPFLVR